MAIIFLNNRRMPLLILIAVVHVLHGCVGSSVNEIDNPLHLRRHCEHVYEYYNQNQKEVITVDQETTYHIKYGQAITPHEPKGVSLHIAKGGREEKIATNLVEYNGVHLSPDKDALCYITAWIDYDKDMPQWAVNIYDLQEKAEHVVYHADRNSFQIQYCRWLGNDHIIVSNTSMYPGWEFVIFNRQGKEIFNGRDVPAFLYLDCQREMVFSDGRSVYLLTREIDAERLFTIQRDLEFVFHSRNGQLLLFKHPDDNALYMFDRTKNAISKVMETLIRMRLTPYKNFVSATPNIHWGDEVPFHIEVDDIRSVIMVDSNVITFEQAGSGDAKLDSGEGQDEGKKNGNE